MHYSRQRFFLTYKGLSVVSVKMRILEVSAMGDVLTFYDGNNSHELADAIIGAKIFKPKTLREKIEELDKNFRRDFDELIKKVWLHCRK